MNVAENRVGRWVVYNRELRRISVDHGTHFDVHPPWSQEPGPGALFAIEPSPGSPLGGWDHLSPMDMLREGVIALEERYGYDGLSAEELEELRAGLPALEDL